MADVQHSKDGKAGTAESRCTVCPQWDGARPHRLNPHGQMRQVCQNQQEIWDSMLMVMVQVKGAQLPRWERILQYVIIWVWTPLGAMAACGSVRNLIVLAKNYHSDR